MLPFLTTNSKNSNYKVNMMITKKSHDLKTNLPGNKVTGKIYAHCTL